MRVALAKLSAAYVAMAGVFGGVMLLVPLSDGKRVAATRTWFERVELRMNPPPDSVSIVISPWSAPLRRVLYDVETPPELRPALEIRPAPYSETDPQSQPTLETPPVPVAPTAPVAPREPLPVRVTAPKITRFATLNRLAPVAVAPGPVKTQVEERLRNNLSRDLFANFDLFLYVSKSTKGPLAQHMYVFAKEHGRGKKPELTLLHDWPVSTGRESTERDIHGDRTSTVTPVGFYQLDPKRFYRRYTSTQWGKPMPNSMFFDWVDHGARTGLAIHGVSDAEELAALGSRASGGCVHLSPEAATSLFNLVQNEYRGLVPRFAYDRDTKTVSNQGQLARDNRGEMRMMDGYRALVVIENYGGQNELSELYMDSGKPEG